MEAALAAHADIVMLVPSTDQLKQAVAQNKNRELEASGGIEDGQLVRIAETGVDYISGSADKHCRALDFPIDF